MIIIIRAHASLLCSGLFFHFIRTLLLESDARARSLYLQVRSAQLEHQLYKENVFYELLFSGSRCEEESPSDLSDTSAYTRA